MLKTSRARASESIQRFGIKGYWEFWQPAPPCDSRIHSVVNRTLELLEDYKVSFLRVLVSGDDRLWVVLAKDAPVRDVAVAAAIAKHVGRFFWDESEIYEEWNDAIYVGGYQIGP